MEVQHSLQECVVLLLFINRVSFFFECETLLWHLYDTCEYLHKIVEDKSTSLIYEGGRIST